MTRASLKVQNAEAYWVVIYPVFGGEKTEHFKSDKDAYRFAMCHRPSRIYVAAKGLPSGDVAIFPLEPEWLSG